MRHQLRENISTDRQETRLSTNITDTAGSRPVGGKKNRSQTQSVHVHILYIVYSIHSCLLGI